MAKMTLFSVVCLEQAFICCFRTSSMVRIVNTKGGGKLLPVLPKILGFVAVLTGIVLVLGFVVSIRRIPDIRNGRLAKVTTVASPPRFLASPPQQQPSGSVKSTTAVTSTSTASVATTTTSTCPYRKLTDLSASERYPVASSVRHLVTPPDATADAGVALVCCQTTVGPWNILVHHNWAKIGARRFLDLVAARHFSNPNAPVPLMRCVDHFLCQFGLNGASPETMKRFQKTIPDDPNWLPEGKEYRVNADGVKRFQKGYLAYAGSGNHSRNLQFIVALQDNGPLAGGSPWEVPWGELVGEHSYVTLAKIYTGYGEQVRLFDW
jgi:cyclophilin family peptidyl-prolyl cis-trans isomerase